MPSTFGGARLRDRSDTAPRQFDRKIPVFIDNPTRPMIYINEVADGSEVVRRVGNLAERTGPVFGGVGGRWLPRN